MDFNRPWLDLPATLGDLDRLGIELSEGLELNVWDADGEGEDRDDLLARGTVYRDRNRDKWCLRITWQGRESDLTDSA